MPKQLKRLERQPTFSIFFGPIFKFFLSKKPKLRHWAEQILEAIKSAQKDLGPTFASAAAT
jgi:hypothetical protein